MRKCISRKLSKKTFAGTYSDFIIVNETAFFWNWKSTWQYILDFILQTFYTMVLYQVSIQQIFNLTLCLVP